MKKLYLLLSLTFIFLSCINEYDATLKGLTKNYVLLENQLEKKLYLDYFNITEKEHLEHLKEYNIAVRNFYNADKKILNYLFSYEEDTLTRCSWISTKNPYDSRLTKRDLITNSTGALILVDNYLRNNLTIQTPENQDHLTFKNLKKFYDKNKNLTKKELRKEYKRFIKE
jgi:hypothetical protein